MKDENEINEFLRLGLKLHMDAESRGQKALALQVLRTTSVVANYWLKELNVISHPVICHCGKQLRTGVEIEAFNNLGECLSCDHVRGDTDAEILASVENETIN